MRRLADSSQGGGARGAWLAKPVSQRAATDQLPKLRLTEDARIIDQWKQSAKPAGAQPGGAAPHPLGPRLLRIGTPRQQDQEVDVGKPRGEIRLRKA
jgi:hypothetical protein